MNQQPSEAVGAAWAFLFVFGIFFFALKTYFEKVHHHTPMSIDLFTIGYIESDITPAPVNNVYNISHNIVNSKNLTKLHLECIDTLIAIGYSKRVARKMVIDYFQNNTASSVQEFIAGVMNQS